MCVFETFGASEGWQTVGDGFELKYRREKKPGFSFMPAPQEYKHDMCNMLAAELPAGELVGCVGVELSKITDKGTPWWDGTQQAAVWRPFISDLVVRQSFRWAPRSMHAIACYSSLDTVCDHTSSMRQGQGRGANSHGGVRAVGV